MRRHPKLIGAFVVLATVVLLGLFFLRASQTGASDTRLCQEIEGLKSILRADKQRSLAQSLAYLEDHPMGTPDIPLSLLKQGIANTRKTLHDLEPRPCGDLPT